MFIVSKFDLVPSTLVDDVLVFFLRSAEVALCPCCQGRLRVIGSRPRTWVQESGVKAKIIIRRLRCVDCRKIHHELPNILVPYRRHEAQVIEAAVTGEPTSADVEESTLRRWRNWFRTWEPYAVGCLRSLAHRFPWTVKGVSAPSQAALHVNGRIIKMAQGWLAQVVRILANLHLWLHTRSAC